jgi:hypothetical protein
MIMKTKVSLFACALTLASPAMAAKLEGSYCPRAAPVPVYVCDPFKLCWIECRSKDGAPSVGVTGVGGPAGEDGVPGNPAVGNPGNAKNVGKAGEKGMDNENPKSGTRGRSGEKGRKK